MADSVVSPAEVLAKLQELSQDLYYQSEGDYPLEVVQYSFAAPTEFTKDTVLALTKNATNTPIEITGLDAFFRHVVIRPNTGTEKEENTTLRARTLRNFLEQHLQEVTVFRIGKRTLSAWLLGKLPHGKLIGLKTTIIET